MKELDEMELREVDGGSTVTNWDNTDNYDGIVYAGVWAWATLCGFFDA